MVTERYGNEFVQTKEISTSRIVGAINEVLRVGMSHNRNIQFNKSIMTHPSSICKLFCLNIVMGVLFLCLFYGEIAQNVKLLCKEV